MDDITDTLRDALHRAAEPGDPTGVADAIRSRVAGGDAGLSAGASGPFAGGRRWMRWIGAGAVLAVVGVGLGLSALLGAPGPGADPVREAEQPLPSAAEPTLEATPPADESTRPEPEPGPASEPGAVPVPETAMPEPPPVDRPPTVDRVSARPTHPFCGKGTSTIVASASDDLGVKSVTISWSGADSGSAAMQPSGNTWTYVYRPSGQVYGQVNVSVRSVDAGGHTSAPRTVVVDVDCLI